MLFTSLVILACKKEQTVLNSNSISQPTKGKNLIVESETTFRTFSEVDSSLLAEGYTEVTIPSNYTAGLEYNASTDELHLYYNDSGKIIEVINYGSQEAAETGGNDCHLKSKSTPDGEECQETGNDCKVIVEDVKITIVCCG